MFSVGLQGEERGERDCCIGFLLFPLNKKVGSNRIEHAIAE